MKFFVFDRPNYSGATTGSIVVNGSGFGTNTNFSPISFIDFASINNGDTPTQCGFDYYENWPSGAHFTSTCGGLTSDGLPVGGGCLEIIIDGDNTNSGSTSDGPFWHMQIYTGDQTAVTLFKHVKFIHVSGTVSSACQYKDTRLCTNTGGNAYSATPKLAASTYTYNGTTGTTAPHYWHEGGGETDFGVYPTLNLYDEAWHCNFTQGKLNSADNVADGLSRIWWDGTYKLNESTVDLWDTNTVRFKAIEPNPGLANSYGSTGYWQVRHARVVAIAGLAWCAVGNASTFAACTDLLVLDPSAWSDTQITADAHGTLPAGYSWAYVMDTSGTLVNSSGITF